MGHHMAHIITQDDHIWAQGALLQAGLARVRTTPSFTELFEQSYKIETAARETAHKNMKETKEENKAER